MAYPYDMMWPQQQMGGYGGGWNRQGYSGGYGGGYQPFAAMQGGPQPEGFGGGMQGGGIPDWLRSGLQEQQQVGNQQARMGQMQQRMSDLQARWGAAGTQDQGQLQNQMNRVQQRMTGLQGRMGDPNATGADRAGFGWRQQRRQAKQGQGAQAEPGQLPQGQGYAPPGAGGQYGGGFYNPQAAAGSPVMSLGTSNYNTQFGELTPISSNGNVFKRNGGDENTLFSQGPGGQWNQMSLQDYQANPNQQYNAPTSNAGRQQQQFFRLGEDPMMQNRAAGSSMLRRGGGR